MRDLSFLQNGAESLLTKATEYPYQGKTFEAVEVYARRMESSSVSLKSGVIKSVSTEDKLEIAIRIVYDGNLGAAVATSFTDDSLIQRAVLSLENQISEPAPFPNLDKTVVDSVSEAVLKCDLEAHVAMVNDLCQRVLAIDDTLDIGIGSEVGVKDTYMCNSNGFSDGYSTTIAGQYIGTTTKKGFRGVSISKDGADFEMFTDDELKDFVNKHHLSETPVEFKGGRLPVIFSGGAMGSLMMRVLGGVNGGNIMKETSPLKDKLGQEILSKKLTIRDDATLPYGVNTRAFDDEGTPAQNTTIIESGVLKSYLVTQGQAIKLSERLNQKIKPTGSATKRTFFSKEIEDSPIVSETNLIVDGERTPDEEIIKSIDYGILVTSVMGAHTGNIIAGDFSLNIGSGFLIEKGQLKGKVQGAMIAGNIYDILKDVEAIGTKDEIMHGIFYSIGISPMVLLKEVNVVV